MQRMKQITSITRAMAAQRDMVFTHAAWSSPKSFTTGMVRLTEMMRPRGAMDMRKMESRSRSWEDRVIMVERVP